MEQELSDLLLEAPDFGEWDDPWESDTHSSDTWATASVAPLAVALQGVKWEITQAAQAQPASSMSTADAALGAVAERPSLDAVSPLADPGQDSCGKRSGIMQAALREVKWEIEDPPAMGKTTKQHGGAALTFHQILRDWGSGFRWQQAQGGSRLR